MGPTSFTMISLDKAVEIHCGANPSHEPDDVRAQFEEALSNRELGEMCETCGDLPVWVCSDSGMCFPCTTGESDASEDYEIEAVQPATETG